MDKITYYTNSGEFIADKLLPCPFCGGEPEFITVGNYHTKSRKAEIECTKCHVRRTTGAIRNDLEWCGRKAIEFMMNIMKNKRQIKDKAVHIYKKMKELEEKRSKLNQIDLLSSEGNKLTEEINKIKGALWAFKWVLEK